MKLPVDDLVNLKNYRTSLDECTPLRKNPGNISKFIRQIIEKNYTKSLFYDLLGYIISKSVRL